MKRGPVASPAPSALWDGMPTPLRVVIFDQREVPRYRFFPKKSGALPYEAQQEPQPALPETEQPSSHGKTQAAGRDDHDSPGRLARR